MPFTLPCVIFAGGKSSRMGRDKALLPYGGFTSLAEYQYRRLSPHFQATYLSAKHAKFPFDAPLILDPPDIENYAPTLGLMAAFEAIGGDFFALAVDTPNVDLSVIEALNEAYETYHPSAVVAQSPSGIHPMCAIYTTKLKPLLERMVERGVYRLGRLLQEADARVVSFPSDDPFFNVNTPQDYQRLTHRRMP